MEDVIIAEGGSANGTIKIMLVNGNSIGVVAKEYGNEHYSRRAYNIDGYLEQLNGDRALETSNGFVYRCANHNDGALTFKALKKGPKNNIMLASVKVPLCYLHMVQDLAEEEAFDAEIEKQEAIEMCHAVCQRMKDRCCEPTFCSDDPQERADAEWLAEMRQAKAAWEAGNRVSRN